MKLILLSLAIQLANALPEVMSFQDWLEEFSPKSGFLLDFWVTPKTDKHREQIYMDNIKIIKEHNARHDIGLETFRLGVNQFSAMNYSEWSSYVPGCLIPRTRPAVPSPEVLDKEIMRRRIEANVSSVDWRQKNVVTDVKDQGQCGSCWAFSATGSMEVAVAIETGNLISLSEQQIMDCSKYLGDLSCKGGLMDNAFEYVEDNHGLDTEADYPYEMSDDYCQKAKEKKHASTIQGFFDIKPNDEQELERAVLIGAVSVAIEADQAAFMHYRSGVYTAKCGTALDHGVLIVGFGTSEEGLDYWIVKNSWGKIWGEQGYMLLERNIQDPSGKCGVAMQPSYPIAGPQPKPGPGPGPKPHPTPDPTPRPTSTLPDYERPVNGLCHHDEYDAIILGVNGTMCFPKCHRHWMIFEVCPEAPVGFNADAECLVQTPAGTKLCVLVCDVNDSESCKPDEGCYCRPIQGIGICTYDDI